LATDRQVDKLMPGCWIFDLVTSSRYPLQELSTPLHIFVYFLLSLALCIVFILFTFATRDGTPGYRPGAFLFPPFGRQESHIRRQRL
jgi:hypothetical protein